MTQQETIEYNKRCAEFLGLKRGWWIHQEKPLTENKKQWWDIDGKTFLGTRVYYDKDLQFHQDWNWIMEVVEAIEMIENDWPISTDEVLALELRSSKETVVQAINQFLIWYNEKK